MHRALLGAGVSVAVAFTVFAQSPSTVPPEVQLPGTQPGEIPLLDTAPSCTVCHGNYDPTTEPWHQWNGSMMAHATRDPLFWASLAVAEQDYPGAGDFCIRCHTPAGWLDGRSTPTNGSLLNTFSDGDGVTCATCHRLTNPDQSEWIGVQNAPFLAHDGGAPKQGRYGSGMYVMWGGSDMLGPYANPPAYHLTQQSAFHRSPQLCGTCHDVSNPVTGDLSPTNGAFTPLPPGKFDGQPGGNVVNKAAFQNPPHAYGVVERTFSEHQASAFAAMPMSAYPSLPAELRQGALKDAYEAAIAVDPQGNYEDGTLRTMSCQSCHMPPQPGHGDAIGVGPYRKDVPQHSLVGGNYFAPRAIDWLDAQGKLKLGGGLPPDQIASMLEGAERAKDYLERAAALTVTGESVRVVNLTGHKLISGYPEGRRMWLRTRWYDVAGNLLRDDGAYGDLAVTVNGQPTVVRTLLDPASPHLRIYEATPALTQAFAQKLVGLGSNPTTPIAFDRVSGQVTTTLADVANLAPGSASKSFHFVLNDTVKSDTRIPPYGFRRDEATTRNALPVPASQYGDPPANGTYRHYDDVALAKPTNAAFARIELLYQPTSWEYVQFLLLANTNQDPFLAGTGQDLYDAWRATGMAEPHVMASTTWKSPSFAWEDLGYALAGTHGEPRIFGFGTLLARQPVKLLVENGLGNGVAHLFIGFAPFGATLYGGTLIPRADIVLPSLPLSASGQATLTAQWPNQIPSGFTLYLQSLIPDPSAPAGFAFTNALRAVTP
jgi:hypothetical protein